MPVFENSYKKNKIIKRVPRKPDRISFKYFSKSKEEVLLLIYATQSPLGADPEVLKFIKNLRGGDLSTVICLGLLFLILSQGVSFIPNNQNPGWGVDRPNPFQPPSVAPSFPPYYDLFFPSRTPSSTLQISRPTIMSNDEFVSLTKEDKRALSNINDMKIIYDGRPDLEVGFWQSKFKVADHGAIHGLSYTIKANGKTKTEKTDANV